MALISTTEESIDWLVVSQKIERIVFDLNHLPKMLTSEDDEGKSFRQIITMLVERDFKIVLLSEHPEQFSDWQNHKAISLLSVAISPQELLANHKALFTEVVFWVTNDRELQQCIAENQSFFAYGESDGDAPKGLHYEYLRDLLEVFNPSQHTALILSEQIIEMKQKAPEKPLIVGVGGPDDCGHSYFVGELVEILQQSDFLIEGIDLTELMGSEFHQQNYWRTSEIQNFMESDVLTPFSKGERVFIEESPRYLEAYETNIYPFFLAPEMILIVWGTTLFTPSFQNMIDWSVLLELSPRVAAARLFGVDERDNFDQEFVKKYESAEGKLYQNYLHTFQVNDFVNHRVNFNNFHAFRLLEA